MSGVGISFGADRIFDVMNQLDIFPRILRQLPVIFCELRGKRRDFLSSRLENPTGRRNQLRDIPRSRQDEEANDLRRQKEYSLRALVGENEINNNVVTLKNMLTGEQESVAVSSLVDKLKSEN